MNKSNEPLPKQPVKSSRSAKIKNIISHEIGVIVICLVVVGLVIGGIAYYSLTTSRVYVEKANIDAPLISLKSESPGVIDQLFVKEGDFVGINMVVAQVGGNPIKTKTSGIVTFVKNTPGQYVTNQDVIVQMIDPEQLRLVGHVQENQGLSDIKTGQQVIFTVDAFGGKNYKATIESVSPSSRESDLVFSISTKRENKVFDVKATFDYRNYPELKNGMSAKMWIYK